MSALEQHESMVAMYQQHPLSKAVEEFRHHHSNVYGVSDAGLKGKQTAEFDRWMQDLFQVLADTVTSVPPRCGPLVQAIAELATEYEKSNGHMGLTATGCYKDEIFETLRKIYTAHDKAVELFQNMDSHSRPDPQALWEQFADDPATRPNYFAKSFARYDDDESKWVGPFHFPNGGINHPAIQKEIKCPGSVISGEWVHPQRLQLLESVKGGESQAAAALAVMQSRYGSKASQTTMTVKDLLEEGQYLEAICRTKKIEPEEVYRVANAHGLEVYRVPRDSELDESGSPEVPTPMVEDNPSPVYDDSLVGERQDDDTIDLSGTEEAQQAEAAMQAAREIGEANPQIDNITLMRHLAENGHQLTEPVIERIMAPIRQRGQ